MSSKLRPADLLHGDANVGGGTIDVAPPISVATTFYSHPDPYATIGDIVGDLRNPTRQVYSRYTADVRTRAEHVLSKINDGYALTYSCGLSACFAVSLELVTPGTHPDEVAASQALTHYAPKRIAVRDGYFGCHASFEIYKRGRDVEIVDLNVDYQEGDLCWLETPVNPTGESRDIKYYADKIHKVGGKLVVDATLGPPPLQYPFKFGADTVLHSATKYLGGHSDLLAGVLIVKTEEEWSKLLHDRTYMGMVAGSLESWLLLRSLRTLHLRIPRQSENATALAKWLQAIVEETASGQPYDGVPPGVLKQVYHSALQQTDAHGFHPKIQMEGGYNALFAITLTDVKKARHLPQHTQVIINATSLGSVESLIEYRHRVDPREDPLLIRLSIGVEDIEVGVQSLLIRDVAHGNIQELKDDLRQAFQKLAELKD
ncbi:hypothetical protein V5O48_003007 [Marasmius crinis-equi]|uniref:Cystathionine gamma-synthase n=1 Tax=Marasmius crinis-equi TaxID=585013 RepID=A0ABR3FU52_9AGAR